MAKKFKPHMMYKGRKAVMAKTMADHLRLKKQGYGHDKPKYKEGGKMPNVKPDNRDKLVKRYDKGGSVPKHSLKRLEEMSAAIEALKAKMSEEKTEEGMAQLAQLRKDYKTLKAEKFIDTTRRSRERKASKAGDVDRAQRIFETRTLREQNDDISIYKKGGKVKSRVNEAGNYTKPAMRKRLFQRIKAGTKGGRAGQWSARKAQLLALLYKKNGGGYRN